MDAVETLNDNFLSCSICMEIFKDPCTLPCGHTFCRICLGKFMMTRQDAILAKSILCPFCKQMLAVPNPSQSPADWPKQFKPHILMQGLLDTFAGWEHGTTERTDNGCCFSCQQLQEKSSASSHCRDCDVLFCDKCAKMHVAMPGMSRHVISKLTGESNVNPSRNVICKEHNNIVEFCCRDCNKAACQKCCIIYHRKCNSVVTIESMVAEIKAALAQKMEKIKTQITDKKSLLVNQQTQIDEINQNKTSVQQSIRSTIQKVRVLIEKKEKQLIDELEVHTGKQTGELRSQIKAGEIDLQMYQQYFEFIHKTLNSDNQMDLYEMFQICKSDAISVESASQLTPRVPLSKMSFVQESDPHSLIQLGHLTISDAINPMGKPALTRTIDIKGEGDADEPDPNDVTVLVVDGVETLVVTDSNNRNVKSFYTKGSKTCSSTLRLGETPFTLSKLSNRQVVVSFWSHKNAFIIVQVTPGLVLHNSIKTKKKYRCLTAMSPTTLAAGSYYPLSVDIIDVKGKVLRSVKNFAPENYLNFTPWYLCCTNKGHIVVSDVESDSFYCFTQDGDVVFSSIQAERVGGNGLRCITTSESGEILLADYHKNKVEQLTESGQFVRDILTPQHDIANPQGIYLHNQNLYVPQEDNRFVKVFSFVSK